MNHTRHLVVTAALTLLVGSATATALASTGPDPLKPVPISDPACVTQMLVADGPSPALADLVNASSTTGIVQVKGVGDAQWTTADGRRPASLKGTQAVIARPVTLTTQEVWKGSSGTATTAWTGLLVGGTVGCDTTLVGSQPEVTPGVYVAMTIERSSPGAATAGPTVIAELWPVADGEVKTDLFGSIPLTTLRSNALAAGQ